MTSEKYYTITELLRMQVINRFLSGSVDWELRDNFGESIGRFEPFYGKEQKIRYYLGETSFLGGISENEYLIVTPSWGSQHLCWIQNPIINYTRSVNINLLIAWIKNEYLLEISKEFGESLSFSYNYGLL